MAMKDVTITVKVTLSVPADNEYDEESYFHAMALDASDFYSPDCDLAVQKVEVALIRTRMCEHPEYRDGRCAEMICDNYVYKH